MSQVCLRWFNIHLFKIIILFNMIICVKNYILILNRYFISTTQQQHVTRKGIWQVKQKNEIEWAPLK